MKKYLLSALALPLLFACSSEDFLDQKATGNDQFAGIEKVDATFSMDEESVTRMATQWTFEPGDQYGFAWLTDKYDNLDAGDVKVPITGAAFQNHPLTQTGNIFKPETSIYVGKYFLYRPYDKSVVSPKAINFTLANQPLANDDSEKHNSTPYKALAASAIIIGDKWTDVDPAGHTVGTTKWDEPGIGKQYDLYAALFSNRTALDLTYKNNNPKFAKETPISGATDINFKIAKDDEVGAVEISKITVDLQKSGASASAATFTYGPNALTKEPIKVAPVDGSKHSGTFWADKKNVADDYGFTFTKGAITLENKDKINTGTEGSKGWFWFNSLPVTAGDAALTDKVVTTYETTFGTVTINDKDGADNEVTLENVAYAREIPSTATTAKEWIKFGSADDLDEGKDEKVWNIAADQHNTFVNQYGNHAGKYAITVDFSKGVMNGMHITDDASLQKALKYYIASGKTENVVLNLDELNSDNSVFEISKISIALIQTINATASLGTVKVQACTTHGTPKIIVTQAGQTTENGLAGKTEVPALNNVFAVDTRVYLAAKNSNGADITWTWGGDYDGDNVAEFDQALPIDNVTSVRNLGTITVNATNLQLSIPNKAIYNEAGATMNITKVTTVKSHLINFGTINVGSETNTDAQLRAYGVEIMNDATDAKDLKKRGTINNYGVIGSSDGTTGQVNNYGEINVKNANAITLLKSNELGIPAFASPFGATKKMGSVVIPSPFALVSVSNGAENGFIKYTWPAATTTYATPTGGVVKYNTIVVSGDITFTVAEPEIQYIEFKGTRTQVINPTDGSDTDKGFLSALNGIIVDNDTHNASIIIEKSNGIVIPTTTGSAFLGKGATIYKGGVFAYPATAPTNNYFGPWTPADQVVVW